MPAPTSQAEITAVLPKLVGSACVYHEAGTLVEATIQYVELLPDRFRIALQARRALVPGRSGDPVQWNCGATWEFAGYTPGMLVGRYNPWTLVYDPEWIATLQEWAAGLASPPPASWDGELTALIQRLAKGRQRGTA